MELKQVSWALGPGIGSRREDFGLPCLLLKVRKTAQRIYVFLQGVPLDTQTLCQRKIALDRVKQAKKTLFGTAVRESD